MHLPGRSKIQSTEKSRKAECLGEGRQRQMQRPEIASDTFLSGPSEMQKRILCFPPCATSQRALRELRLAKALDRSKLPKFVSTISSAASDRCVGCGAQRF